MSKIALCMIVKDDSESKDLKKCLDSISKYVDGIFITGTNKPDDKIKELTAEYGGLYSFYEWNNDFAQARNYNFSQVTENFTHYFWLDADDIVKGGENLHKLADIGPDWLYFMYYYAFNKTKDCIAKHWKYRLIKKDTGTWQKSIHEDYTPSMQVTQAKDDSVIVIHNRTKGKAIETQKRNLSIGLEEYLRDQEKTDPRTLFYLGNVYYGMGNYSEAFNFYLQHIQKSKWNEERYFAMNFASGCLKFMGRFDEAINLLLEAVKLFPEWATAYFLLAEQYLNKGDYKKCIEWSLVGFSKKIPDTVLMINELDYTINPMGRLVYTYLATMQFEKADALVNKMLTISQSKEVKNLKKLVDESLEIEDFVNGFVNATMFIFKKDRLRAVKMFDSLPITFDDDIRIQKLRNEIVPPKIWENSVVFFCGRSLETWADPSILKGIGGSEEATIQMARLFAKKGYKTVVYNHCGQLSGTYNGVEYKPYYHFNPKDTFDIFIGWRSPELFACKIKANKKFLWLHDRPFEIKFNDDIINNVDKIIVLSKYQRRCLPKIPDDKFLISRNGLNMVDIIASDNEVRNPHRIIWSSSYDRGLDHLLKRWGKIRKAIPDAELFVCYGWEGFLQARSDDQGAMKWKAEMDELLKQDGIIHAGRINHKQLAKEFAQSGLWVYPTAFWEISCITAQRAQASGCIPICTDYAALSETVQFGEKIKGITEFEVMPDKVIDKIIDLTIDYMKNPKKQEDIRPQMMEWARKEYDWSGVADQWEGKF